MKKQSQKQNQKKNQNPGGNPPDPFFLLIIDHFQSFVRANFKCDCPGSMVTLDGQIKPKFDRKSPQKAFFSIGMKNHP
ncbi:MAG: hypothetical protein H7829_14300 [Magnetococcus sp. THC-1_WYH]